MRKCDEPLRPGSAGKVISDAFEVKIIDEDDNVQPAGVTGEIVVRPKIPFSILHEYNGMPDETVRACRNLWFHTGDLGKIDEDGYLYFKDKRFDSKER